MNPARTAIIDLGTNTFHVLIAERQGPSQRMIFAEKVPVKLGQGGINQGMITPEAIHRALDALKYFKRLTEKYQVDKTLAFGTSALRQAANRDEVLNLIQHQTGFTVTVINGDQEAEYIYEGVKSALRFTEEKVLVMDIGGGSVEFIIADGRTIFWKRSYEIGAQRLLERFHRHDPILSSEREVLHSYLSHTLAELFTQLDIHRPATLAGASGTFDTLSEMYCARHYIPYDAASPETPFAIEEFPILYEQLISKTRAERLALPGMIAMRVDMIVVACCLITFIMERHPFDSVRVSTYSLKEGVLQAQTSS